MWSTAALLVPVAWLVPNHYFPWVSAWPDAWALACLGLGLLACKRHSVLAPEWVVSLSIALAVVVLQVGLGRISFAGDGLMVFLYVVAFAAAVCLGASACEVRPPSKVTPSLDGFAIAVFAASTASVGVALVQWTGAVNLGLWGVEMPPGGRPYGNVAQPNHLCTIAFLGLCSLALLHQRGRIGATGLGVGAAWLLFGMVMTASRTGWLQLGALALMAALLRRRSALRIGALPIVAAAALYALAVIGWPTINDALALAPGRAGQEVSGGGTRPLHWAAMLAAIRHEPWLGYGWLQVGVAQVRTADTQPFVGEYIEHSHNLFLDLLIWNGLPVGLVLCGILVWWFTSRLARCRDGTVFWLMAAITGLAGHAMVEYPLSFAYFLIPMGFWIGAVDAVQGRPGWSIRAGWLRFGGLAFTAVLAWVAVDYLKAEQGYRLLRMESARIGVQGLTTPPPELQLLTQLEAFQRFAHTQARPGMSAEALNQMRKVSERYAYPPSLFRYALAQGLNGQPEGAALTLLRLCRIHPHQRCDEGREAWAGLQQQHPSLQQVPYPTRREVDVLK